MTKYTFEDYQLKVDYMTLSFPGLNIDGPEIQDLVFYFSKIGFNSFEIFPKKSKRPPRELNVDTARRFSARFLQDYNRGVTLHFTGRNGKWFYNLICQKKTSWDVFPTFTLTRFDLCHDRRVLASDTPDADRFLDHLKLKLKGSYKRNSKVETKEYKTLLTIGSRRSANFFRVYQKDQFIRFEHELKGDKIKEYTPVLTSGNAEDLNELEYVLGKRCLKEWGKRVSLNFTYMDWLSSGIRKIRRQTLHLSLKSDYLDSTVLLDLEEKKDFFTLLQFLDYCRTLDYEPGILEPTRYRKFRFKLRDFLGFKEEPKTSHWLYKAYVFLTDVRKNSCLTIIKDKEIRLLSIPEIWTDKPGRSQECSAWIAEEYFRYTHPFNIPRLPKANKHQTEIQFEFIKVFCSPGIQKRFDIPDFLENFPSALTGTQRANIKKYFITLVEIFRKADLITAENVILREAIEFPVEKFTSRNISQGFIVYEKIS